MCPRRLTDGQTPLIYTLIMLNRILRIHSARLSFLLRLTSMAVRCEWISGVRVTMRNTASLSHSRSWSKISREVESGLPVPTVPGALADA